MDRISTEYPEYKDKIGTFEGMLEMANEWKRSETSDTPLGDVAGGE